MEELPREPLVRGVEQEDRRERDRQPAVVDPVARQEEDRDRPRRLHHHLRREQEQRPRAEPVEGHEQQQDRVDVVPEELEPAHGDERVVEAGEQPDRLVVDAQVERVRGEALLADPPQHDEHDAPPDHHGPEHPAHRIAPAERVVARPAAWPHRPSASASCESSSVSRSEATVTPEILPRMHARRGSAGAETPEGGGRLGASMGLFNKILHAGEGRKLKSLESIPPVVGGHEPEMEARSDDDLRALTGTWREQLDQIDDHDKKQEHLDDLLPEAFAAVREAGKRTLGQRHFDVQVMGGAGLHFGWVAEMKTGEGKTLVATLPAYLNALSGGGVHLVTVNDYLAKRDAEWMGQIYRFLGLEVGTVIPEIDDFEAEAPRLRLRHHLRHEQRVRLRLPARQHGRRRGRPGAAQPHFAIVDEVDSILIDEARTPLIISGRADDAQELYVQFAAIVKPLKRDHDYEVDEAKRTVVPTEVGVTAVEKALGVDNLYENVNQNFVHQLQAALRAQGAVQARRRLRRAGRRGQDRRRVHRPHPRGPALERGPPPGGRGQGAGEDQGGEPDARDDHAPELLPHVRQARAG